MQPDIGEAHREVRKVAGEIARLRRRVQKKPRQTVSQHTVELLRLRLKAAIERRRAIKSALLRANAERSPPCDVDRRPSVAANENAAVVVGREILASPKRELEDETPLVEVMED